MIYQSTLHQESLEAQRVGDPTRGRNGKRGGAEGYSSHYIHGMPQYKVGTRKVQRDCHIREARFGPNLM